MKSSLLTKSKVIVYDVILALLYSWAVFQAYMYDAKTQTTGIMIYIAVYLGFTLLVRSPSGGILMNGLSALTLPSFSSYPIIHQAGAYFDLQPYIGEFATLSIANFPSPFCPFSHYPWKEVSNSKKSVYLFLLTSHCIDASFYISCNNGLNPLKQ